MASGIDAFGQHVKNSIYLGAWGGSYGFAVGTAAAYLATALKITKAANFMSIGLAAGAGLATNWFLTYAVKQASFIQNTAWSRELVNNVAVPIISMLAAIYIIGFATPMIYNVTAVGVGVFFLANWLQPNPIAKRALVSA